MGTHTGLIAHWPLAGDCRDHSGNGHHGRNRGADLMAGGAALDGRGAHILVPRSPGLDLGTGDFTLAVQIHTDAVLDDVPGDIVSRYAPATRTGFQLSLLNNAVAHGPTAAAPATTCASTPCASFGATSTPAPSRALPTRPAASTATTAGPAGSRAGARTPPTRWPPCASSTATSTPARRATGPAARRCRSRRTEPPVAPCTATRAVRSG